MTPLTDPLETEGALEPLFAERLRFEHELIGQRMSWLMTLNSFVIGGLAVLAASAPQLDGSFVVSAASLVLALLGLLSNGSCLFSNFHATRAIHEAGLALDESWRNLPADLRRRRRESMRLFGRDPRQVHRRGAPPPSQVLHPWLLLPLIFVLFFFAVPYLGAAISDGDRDVAFGWTLLAELVIAAPFAVLPFLDRRHYRLTGPAPEADPEAAAVLGGPSAPEPRAEAVGDLV